MLYWFPGDLPLYITRWPIPGGAEVRLTAAILEGQPATLRAVYSTDYDAMVAGTHTAFTDDLDASARGFYETDWQAASGVGEEVYIGIVVDTEEDITDLIIGLAEVQIRS